MQFMHTSKGTDGTSLQGTIYAPYSRLVEVFGEPNGWGEEGVTQKHWIIKFEDDTVATIYDWKQHVDFSQVTEWNVGGHKRQALYNVTDALDDKCEFVKPKYTEDQIADAAEQACFYVTPGGLWLRMDFCDMDEGYFQAHDEESYEEYRIEFSELIYDDVEFHKLEKMSF